MALQCIVDKVFSRWRTGVDPISLYYPLYLSPGCPEVFVMAQYLSIFSPFFLPPGRTIQMHCFSFLVNEFHGEVLKLKRVQRHQMGAYLCIASNGVPPSVSKRIKLNVNCE